MASEKQKKAFDNAVENHGNISKAMRDAGYTDATAKNPKNLTESRGWAELLEETIPDRLLQDTLQEGLLAVKGSKEDFDVDYAVRHKYLDTAYKLKDKYPAKKLGDMDVKDLAVTFAQVFKKDA